MGPIIFLALDKVLVGDNCWEWTGAKDQHGYGRIGTNSKGTFKAHRVVYEHFVGPIEPGLVLDHLCFNTSCVRPVHLEPVTQAENVRRSFARITHCPSGHPYDKENTLYRDGGKHRRCRTCHSARERARRMGTSCR